MENSTRYLLIGAGAALLLFVYTRTKAGQEQFSIAFETIGDTLGETVSKVTSAVRGIRNNNPGNIRKSATAWQGLSADQSDPAFFRFDAMEYGIRAIVKILQTYQGTYGLNTVRKIINRWAPPVENNTDAYVSYVAARLGVSPDSAISVNDGNTVFALVRAIIAQENGAAPALLISDSTVAAGIALA